MSELEDAAQKRKERLALLKSAKRKREGGDDSVRSENEAVQTKMNYRNYDPETKDSKLGFLNNPSASVEEPTVEQRAEALARETKLTSERLHDSATALNLTTLQPKRPNADLKRALEDRIAKLRPKQERVVREYVKERLRKTQKEAQVSVGAITDGTNLMKRVHRLEQAQIEQSNTNEVIL